MNDNKTNAKIKGKKNVTKKDKNVTSKKIPSHITFPEFSFELNKLLEKALKELNAIHETGFTVSTGDGWRIREPGQSYAFDTTISKEDILEFIYRARDIDAIWKLFDRCNGISVPNDKSSNVYEWLPALSQFSSDEVLSIVCHVRRAGQRWASYIDIEF